MYNRAFPVGNALFLIAGGMMNLFCLPCGKLAFENTPLSAGCKKTRRKLWQKERGLDGAGPLDKKLTC
jgi:hypothetical protein